MNLTGGKMRIPNAASVVASAIVRWLRKLRTEPSHLWAAVGLIGGALQALGGIRYGWVGVAVAAVLGAIAGAMAGQRMERRP